MHDISRRFVRGRHDRAARNQGLGAMDAVRIEHNGVVVRDVPIAIARGDDSLYGRIAPVGNSI